MDGHIAELLTSGYRHHQDIVCDVFGPGFQDISHWRSFLRSTLNDNTSAMFAASGWRWSVDSFQALFIACWIHHPVEKGTYMINIEDIGADQREVLKAAYKKHLYGRKSSHLSGSGRSASKDWRFLNGYKELLVQIEDTKGTPYLMLKSEGHTTGPAGIIPHLHSWVHKKKHGEGLMASEALHKLASFTPMAEGRAAENYGKGYKALLKEVLGFHGKDVTVRDMIGVLFDKANYDMYAVSLPLTATNLDLGNALDRYCQDAAGGVQYRIGGRIDDEMIADLRSLAGTLKHDGDVRMPRVFREIRVIPQDLDRTLTFFYNLG